MERAVLARIIEVTIAVGIMGCGATSGPGPTLSGPPPAPDSCPPVDYRRGLIVQKGEDGMPAIRVGLFRSVQELDAGRLDFDMRALAKVEKELSGSSQTSDFSMGMKNSTQGIAPKIGLHGAFRLVGVLPGDISYADLTEAPWHCPGSGQRDYDPERPENHDLCGPTTEGGSFTMNMQWPRRGRFDGCDPSGHTRIAYDLDRTIHVFTVSTNPLFPGPDYYNEWGSEFGMECSDHGIRCLVSSETLATKKTGFQIFWLLTKQKGRSTGQ